MDVSVTHLTQTYVLTLKRNTQMKVKVVTGWWPHPSSFRSQLDAGFSSSGSSGDYGASGTVALGCRHSAPDPPLRTHGIRSVDTNSCLKQKQTKNIHKQQLKSLEEAVSHSSTLQTEECQELLEVKIIGTDPNYWNHEMLKSSRLTETPTYRNNQTFFNEPQKKKRCGDLLQQISSCNTNKHQSELFKCFSAIPCIVWVCVASSWRDKESQRS